MGSQPVTESRTHGASSLALSSSSLQPTAPTLTHVYASYIDEPVLRWQTSGSTALYYHRNQQYSVYAVTNSSGAVQERYAYTAYGVPTSANASGTQISNSAISNRYLYTGREWDSVIHQYHYRARMYDPSLGRFCSRDPIGYFRHNFNLPGFLDSSPLRGNDPTGLAIFDPWALCNSMKTIVNSGIKVDCPGWSLNLSCVSSVEFYEKTGFYPTVGGGVTNGCNTGSKTINIMIAPSNFIDEASLIETLTHEMIHATNMCKGCSCDLLNQDEGESDDEYCNELFCSELRAILGSGRCFDSESAGVDFQKSCLKTELEKYFMTDGGKKCKPKHLVNALEKCWWPTSGSPPYPPPFPFPEL